MTAKRDKFFRKCASFSCHVEYVGSCWIRALKNVLLSAVMLNMLNMLNVFGHYNVYKKTQNSTWQLNGTHFPENMLLSAVMLNMLNHVESGPPKKLCFFQLSCWICWICWMFSGTTGQILASSVQIYSTYSTYSTWQQKEALFLAWFNMIQHIQHDSWKKHILWKLSSFQLSCWILCFFTASTSVEPKKLNIFNIFNMTAERGTFLEAWFNMIQHIQHDSWKKHFLSKKCSIQPSCWISKCLHP